MLRHVDWWRVADVLRTWCLSLQCQAGRHVVRSCWASSSPRSLAFNLKELQPFDTSATTRICQSTRRNIPEDVHLQRRRESSSYNLALKMKVTWLQNTLCSCFVYIWVFCGDPYRKKTVMLTVRFIYIYTVLLRHVAVCCGCVSQSVSRCSSHMPWDHNRSGPQPIGSQAA
jgi:hypothetical protein